MHYLTVDGMLSGTGIRDAVSGGYIEHTALGISPELSEMINCWLARYEKSHYDQFEDVKEVEDLDNEGIRFCHQLQKEIPESKIGYFSSAKMCPFF